MPDLETRLNRTDAQEDCGFISKQKDPYVLLSEMLGPTFKEYRRQWEAASSFDLETAFPLQLDFELNFSCNLRCPMCTWSVEATSASAQKDHFPKEKFEEIVRYGVSKGLKALDMSFVNEPLMRPDLPDFIEFAKKEGIIDIGFNTNATLLTESIARRLIQSGMTRIQFSLDAFSVESYNKVRTGGDYNKVLRNIQRFLDLKQELNSALPLTAVSFVKQRDNIHEVDAFVEYWEPRVDYLLIREYLNPVLPNNAHFDEKSEMFSDSRHFAGEFRCTKPWQRMVVRHDGTLLPCCTFQGAFLPMGNAFNTPIEEVWSSQRMKDLRHIHKSGEFHKNAICKACALSSTATQWEK